MVTVYRCDGWWAWASAPRAWNNLLTHLLLHELLAQKRHCLFQGIRPFLSQHVAQVIHKLNAALGHRRAESDFGPSGLP